MGKILELLLKKKFIQWDEYKKRINKLEQKYWEEEQKRQETLFKSK